MKKKNNFKEMTLLQLTFKILKIKATNENYNQIENNHLFINKLLK